MSWIVLFVAGLFEVAWAVGLKHSDGFTRPLPTIATVAAMVVSLALLGIALRSLPLGTAYAVWTAIGTIGTAFYGIWWLHESADPLRLACIGMIAVGVIGLKWAAP
jgi:quaternary ammonium compound-resistance protein SugE